MTNEERITLGKAMAAAALYYGRQLNQDALTMMLDDLESLSLTEALNALGEYRKNRKNRQFPLPADLLDIAKPQVDPESAAREIVARIHHGIVRIGPWREQEARKYIGEVGWSVVEKFGGWTYLNEHHGLSIDPNQFQAQARELAKANLKFTPQQLNEALNASPKESALQLVGSLIKEIE